LRSRGPGVDQKPGQIKAPNPNAQTGLVSGGKVNRENDPPFLNWREYYLSPNPSPPLVPDPIFPLAASGDLDSVRAILRLFPEKAYLHYELNGLLPIHMAAWNGEIEVVEFFLSYDSELGKGKFGSPLHWASGAGETPLVERLLDKGLDPNARACNDVFELTREVRDLLLVPYNCWEEPSPGWTPLHWAADRGRLETARLLLERGAEVDSREDRGTTPLFSAVWRGHLDLVEPLLEAGADVNACASDGETPLHRVPWSRHRGPEIGSRLLDAGADPNGGESGFTPLHQAAILRSLVGVERLLASGADPNIHSPDGLSVLHVATAANSPEVVMLLVEAGADTTQKHPEVGTPEEWAKARDRPGLEELLRSLARPSG
jgi:ankyrin repeat protein